MSRHERRHRLVGRPELWKLKRQFQIDFLTRSGLSQDHMLCDLGCGTLRGGIPLIQFLDAHRYYGIDSRQTALDEGYCEIQDYGLEHKHPTLVLAEDLATRNLDVRFDVIWSFSVLFHMDDGALDKALGFVASHLKVDGVFYANVKIGDDQPQEWQGFPVLWRSYESYASRCRTHGLDMDDIGDLASLGHITGIQSHDTQRMLRIKVAVRPR